MVKEGTFRQDLYYRLNVIEINVPPLRDRGDDVLFLARAFIKELGEPSGSPAKGLDKNVERLFLAYPWPGNIRELRNVIERAVVIADDELITVDQLPERFAQPGIHGRVSPLLKDAHEEFEAAYIQKVVAENGGDKELVSKILGIDLSTLYRKIKKYDIRC
jgi:two-component system response regulator HydG